MATKKKIKKMIAACMAELPTITHLTNEKHYVKGTELLDQGHYEDPEGKKIIADAQYKQAMPVIMSRNHQRGMQAAFAKKGRAGVTDYLARMRKIVESN